VSTKYFTRLLLVVILALGGFNFSTVHAAGVSQACASDRSLVCPDVSAVHFTSDAPQSVDQSSSGSTLYSSTSATKLTFTYTSSSVDAGKTLIIQFFDVTAGLKFIIIPNPASSNNCNPQLTIQKQCQISLNSNGNASFNVALFGATEGTGFNYQLLGSTAWTSGAVRVNFTPGGWAPSAPLACAGEKSQVCAPISNLAVHEGSRTLQVSAGEGGDAGMSVGINSQFLEYAFTSSSAYAFKTVYVDFFDVSQSTSLLVDTSTDKQGAGCDKQVANANGCFIHLDANGSASFLLVIMRSQLGDSFKFKINGVSYTSNFIRVAFTNQSSFTSPSPSSTPTPVVTPTPSPTASFTAKAIKGAIQIVASNGKSKKLTISGPGIRASTFTISADSASVILPVVAGKYTITITLGNLKKSVTLRVQK